jgi:hypothetical protein
LKENLEEKEIRHWFEHHVATAKKLDDDTVMVEWAKPGTMVYSITYIVRNSTLMVYGDLQEAVYRWSGSHISFPFLASCGLGYFHEKCEASPEGRQFRSWDEKTAIKDFKDYVRDYLRNNMTADEVREWKTKWADDYDRCLSGIQEGSQFFWHMTLHDCDDFRSDGLHDDDHYLYTIGMPITIHCHAHLVGIRMAVEQLIAKGVFRDE